MNDKPFLKTIITFCGVAVLLLAPASKTQADIIAGPITNPANGHDYYLLSADSWTVSEAEAESLHGTLAIIRNADEEKWVFSTFGSCGGINRGGLWIGLHRLKPGGPFAWVTDAKLDYVDWAPGEPNNVGGIEDSAHMQDGGSAGTWNDLPDSSRLDGVVELPGRANEIVLSEHERALIGDWYDGGKVDRPCSISSTGSALFVIPSSHVAVRARLNADGFLWEWPVSMRPFSSEIALPDAGLQFGPRGQLIGDYIVWSDGTWWSRKPVNFKPVEKPLANQ